MLFLPLHLMLIFLYDTIGPKVIMKTLGLKYDSTTRWFYLHVVVNSMTSIMVLSDTIHTITNPLDFIASTDQTAANLTLALHLYHFLFFGPLTEDDYIHHGIMIGTMFVINIYDGGSITQYLIFHLNGFPGFLSYGSLLLAKGGKIKWMTQKRFNNFINTWIRCPGIIYGCTLLWVYYNQGQLDHLPAILVFYNLFTSMWNGPYYASRVAFNYGYKTAKGSLSH